jgi:hypothetical protein
MAGYKKSQGIPFLERRTPLLKIGQSELLSEFGIVNHVVTHIGCLKTLIRRYAITSQIFMNVPSHCPESHRFL